MLYGSYLFVNKHIELIHANLLLLTSHLLVFAIYRHIATLSTKINISPNPPPPFFLFFSLHISLSISLCFAIPKRRES
ncbi:hypothetical protein L2E82_32671 [Cichorium intybus]|uniref:Uncharacterized protein n=1 Tax=Cichorium intybus TaxID=13427 RepID=A0ACB9BH31_CICIN|nr:hypothetical protein L2E82_32671 [Cichorium intybus]